MVHRRMWILVIVGVVKVREMRMAVRQARVAMPMRMQFAGWIICRMVMVMMLVVDVRVFVLHRLMDMAVLVPFGHVEVKTKRHQNRRTEELRRYELVKHDYRHKRAHERSDREVRARPRRPDMAKREHEQHQTHAVTEESDYTGAHDSEWRRCGGADSQGQDKVGCARHQTFQRGDLHGVCTGNFSREIVVDAPRQACGRDRKRTHTKSRRATLP